MNNKMFNDGEELFFKSYPSVKKEVLSEFDRVNQSTQDMSSFQNYDNSSDMSSNGQSNEKQMVRVRTMDGAPVVKSNSYEPTQFNDFSVGDSYGGYNNNQSGTSFVIVLCTILALVAVVYLVSTFIFFNI